MGLIVGAAVPATGIAMTQPSPATAPSIVSFVDCDPSSSSFGQSTQASGVQEKSCDANGVTGRAATSFDTIRVFGSALDSAPVSDRALGYGQSGRITDSLLILPDDDSLMGSAGQVGIAFDFDGTVVGDAGFEFYADYLINNFNGTVSRIDAPKIAFDFLDSGPFFDTQRTGSRTNGIVGFGVSGFSQPKSFDGTLTAFYDVIFGEVLTYSFSFLAEVDNRNGKGGTADFESTALLSGYSLFDDTGAAVAATFTTGSGEVDFQADGEQPTTPAPIPVPAAMPLLLAGLGGLWALRRRRGA